MEACPAWGGCIYKALRHGVPTHRDEVPYFQCSTPAGKCPETLTVFALNGGSAHGLRNELTRKKVLAEKEKKGL
jgi:hypothetical protein